MAISVEVFFLPSKISSGGISSIGTVLYYTFKIPLSVTNILFNAILFVFGVRYLNKSSIIKTLYGVFIFTFFLEIVSYIPVYKDDVFVATITGGVIMGIGVGLVIRSGGSTGGSDFAGILINRFVSHISIPKLIFLIDICIIMISAFAFKSITVMLYSGVALYLSSKIGDAVICAGNSAKHILIISESAETIANKVLFLCARGATGIFCKGMYSGEHRLAVMCVVSPREVSKIMDIIKSIDSNAFVVISDVREVLGEGFKTNIVT